MKNNKKGFTLIELLAVIIILAVIALIATPIVLNVVENARKQSNKNSAYGLLDAAKLYYTESLLDISKQSNINGTTNLINEIKVSGKKPDSGEIYINKSGQSALAVIYDDVCYIKNFEESKITESDDTDNCNIIETSEVSYKCKRATTLHTETCNQTDSGCYSVGYSSGSTITYGSLGTTGTLTSGDAFDCDVNGDGAYDATTERFYYVSDLYNTTSKSFDSNYAVLIYYNNTTLGVADESSSSLIAYYSAEAVEDSKTLYGPLTAITNLPTTTQWSNVTLSNTSRAILDRTGESKSDDVSFPSAFSYSGYAARMLTYQEVSAACSISDDPFSAGSLDSCNYVFENTYYSTDYNSLLTPGFWLETPSGSHFANSVYSGDRTFDGYYIFDERYGVRPAIEVLKTDIEI